MDRKVNTMTNLQDLSTDDLLALARDNIATIASALTRQAAIETEDVRRVIVEAFPEVSKVEFFIYSCDDGGDLYFMATMMRAYDLNGALMTDEEVEQGLVDLVNQTATRDAMSFWAESAYLPNQHLGDAAVEAAYQSRAKKIAVSPADETTLDPTEGHPMQGSTQATVNLDTINDSMGALAASLGVTVDQFATPEAFDQWLDNLTHTVAGAIGGSEPTTPAADPGPVVITPEDLQADQDRMKALLTNHDIHCHIPADELDDFVGYEGFNFNSEVQQVADILFEHYSPNGPGNDTPFVFGFECNSEGEISSYTVGISLDSNFYLLANHDIKHATFDRSATGEAAAIQIGLSLENDYLQVLHQAKKSGLITAA